MEAPDVIFYTFSRSGGVNLKEKSQEFYVELLKSHHLTDVFQKDSGIEKSLHL